MSWNGPIAGAAPYQPPQYPQGPPGYGQHPPYQYGQQPGYGQYPPTPTFPPNGQPQRPLDNRPPKKKGNPVITRYPPPPGYRGPAQPQGPFGTNQYSNQYQPPQPGFPQAPPNGYAQTPPAPQTYSNQAFSAPPPGQAYHTQGYAPPQPPTYHQPPHPQAQNQQWPQQGYPPNQAYSQPNQGFSQAPGYPGGQGHTPSQSTYNGYPHQPAPVDQNQQSYDHSQGWQAPNGQASYQANNQAPGWQTSNVQQPYPPNDHYNSYNGTPTNGLPMSDPNSTPTPTTAHLAVSQPHTQSAQPVGVAGDNGASEKPQLFLAWDDWDFDFDGAIWPKSNEPVDPNLSLGVIIWHPAKQVTRALPSTFADAEEQAMSPTPETLDNAESVSVYFTAENSHEAFLNVRQTDDWERVQNDPVFVVFTDDEMRHNLVALEDCIAQRDRPDEFSDDMSYIKDEEMPDSAWSIMDHLEQALSASGAEEPRRSGLSRAGSSTSFTQEDILAKLGVTGAPKPPSHEAMPMSLSSYDEKPPSSLPEKPIDSAPPSMPLHTQSAPQSAQVPTGHQNFGHGPAHPRPYGSMSSSILGRPPPPPPPPERQRYDPWNANNFQHQQNSHGFGSPARSDGSNRTMVGSDFESDKPMGGTEDLPTPVPKLHRSDSSSARKRSYEDTDQYDEKQRQHDDQSKRKRRSQVDAVYSRR
ncbi:hypothetical protein P153DRAFT_22300 [Dothidotthia symphoricarpi CBS 119687]|uniref:Uncharacterized protein n=1 Tax=Dothidotthia symphoricarpi CBS 119687 TaxID=1392245 RepID=A0A6A6AER1_9PLEO|nr:uncharacterized protein P153DRAFT_22300 [Dothidotthia symphoricarpi CBS 119687]KAF2129595.1 hypothetical protein P153DRAFT_22300 [Dothidotthia symphoricarpi CBS 119687]